MMRCLLSEMLSKPKPHLDTVASYTSYHGHSGVWIIWESAASIVEKYPFLSKALYVRVYLYAHVNLFQL